MKEKVFILVLILITAAATTTSVHAANSNFQQQIYVVTECNDGIDNDGDGGIDFSSDPQCLSWEDNSEQIDENLDLGLSTAPKAAGAQPQQSATLANDVEISPASGTIVSNFTWTPLAKVLGLSDSQISKIDQNPVYYSFAFIGVSYVLVVLVLAVISLNRLKKIE